MAVKLLVSSIFNPALSPSEEEEGFSQYAKEEIKALAHFMEVKQQCPMMVRPILPILFLIRTNLQENGRYSEEH